mgnify:CR=1 FL=1
MGSGGVAIAALPTVICLKVPFSDGLGGVKSAFDIGTYKMSRITLRRVIRHDDYLVQGGNKKLRCTRLWNTPKMKNENVYLKEEK